MISYLIKFLAKLACALALLTAVAWLVLTRPLWSSVVKTSPPGLAIAETLETHTRKLSQEFFPRDWKHPENLNRASEYIRENFSSSNQRVSFQNFKVDGTEYRNVISEYGTPSAAGTIVVGAHYDAFEKRPGADDNASGVAGLLELGRLLSAQTLSSKVVLVAYSLEEPPFFGTEMMGSAVHAASLVTAGEKVKLMIALEMIGYFSETPGSQSFPFPLLNLFYPSEGNFVAVIGPMTLSSATVNLKRAMRGAIDLEVVSLNAPSRVPGVDLSDHRNYWKEGFDAVMISDTAFFRNHAYHTDYDTADRLDYRKMAQVITGLNAAVLLLANGAGS